VKEFDTIVAVATSLGESGISIIRVSGNNALTIVSSIFKGKNNRSINDIKSYTMRYGNIINKINGEYIDEVIVSYMKGPRSFTADDTLEINCHGGIIVTNRVLEEVVRAGARIAEPGEFTKRAFLNGRIDLSQAEAVIDIIRAKTELSMKSALEQSGGKISREISKIRHKLLGVIAHIEATVDFPEDDLEEITSKNVIDELKFINDEIKTLLMTSDEGKILREGLSAVIIGKPNVGKSSLLNAFLNENRSIVTEVPGTTRDVIEEYINIDGIPIKVVDTAGIRQTENIIEKIGIEKSKDKINEADLILLMIDSSNLLEKEDLEIIDYIIDKKYIIILNKSDLENKMDIKELRSLNSNYIIAVSAKTGEGLNKVQQCIKKLFFNGEIESKDMFITNTRHKEALIRAQQNLEDAKNVLNQTYAIDLASIDLRNAWKCLGEITGETLEEDIIEKIFSEFCIGK